MLWQPFGRVAVPECSVCNESQDIFLGVAPGLSLQGGYLLSASAKLDANAPESSGSRPSLVSRQSRSGSAAKSWT